MSGADNGQQAAGDKWGDDIPPERQAELAVLAERQREWVAVPETLRGDSAFKGLRLTGADVFWLAAQALAKRDEERTIVEYTERLRNARDDFSLWLDLGLAGLHLERANLNAAHLEHAPLYKAHLEGTNLFQANLNGALLREAHLEGANLTAAHLENADLTTAHLEGTLFLWDSHLEGADLSMAHLEGANLNLAHLEGAKLNRASLDAATNLTGAVVSDQRGWLATTIHFLLRRRSYGAISLADVRWNGFDLTRVDWSAVRRLGDEHTRRWWWWSRWEAETATRANIQLSKQLDNAGLKDDSDRFAYRAQVCQRRVYLRCLRLGRWLFSWLLFILAGYGYRPLRTLFWYLAVIGGFAFAYYSLGPSVGVPLPPLGAVVFSVTSFHGRGFFPVGSPGHSVTLDDPLTVLAAAEAVLGLLIEVSFIATFTQRYFGK